MTEIARNRLVVPVRLPALFILLTGVPLFLLGWLGWRVLQQDQALEIQRSRERLENAASLLTRELDRSLVAWEDTMTVAAQSRPLTLPPHATFLRFDFEGVLHQRGISLPYYPAVPTPADAAPQVFAAAEAQEFRDRDLAGAAASYRRLAASSERTVRAGALMRLARCMRKQQQVASALAVYVQLAAMGDVPVAGSPAELIARHERITLLRAAGSIADADREAILLSSTLSSGRFLLDRPTYDFFSELDSGAAPAIPSGESLALAQAVQELWPAWHEHPSGRSTWINREGSYASVWRRSGSETSVLIGSVEDLLAGTRAIAESLQVRLELEDQTGGLVWGDPSARDNGITRLSRETGLPWIIHIAIADPVATRAASASRRNLFAAGFGLMVLIMAAASYFVFRAVNRELGVARLQSDFVDAVSHEFRTPLTAMCHLTEMLEDGATPPDRLRHYYAALARESRRLQTMVENLLDFGRIEAGRRTYEFVETDATDLVSNIVHELREQAPSTAHRLEFLRAFDEPSERASDAFRIHADRAALGLALRNLVDNALKYSPATSAVKVSVQPRGSFVGISVEDEGPGIPKDEQRDVFRKFVRGAAARTLNVKGTGIGLTLAEQIVKAHGGRLELASEPGRGSRFTTLLPAMPRPA